MSRTVIKHMRARAAQLRRVAAMAHNIDMTEMLLKMAGEIETDARRLERDLTAAKGGLTANS